MKDKLKGIDISEFNGVIDFKKVKSQVDFIMIRATFGRFGVDKKFEENVKACIKYDIPFGFYYYSYAIDEKRAIDEVNFFLEKVKPYKEKATFPFVIDMEDSDFYKKENGNPTKEELTNICIKACEIIKSHKLIPMIYANKDWFENKLDLEKLSPYYKWLAWWINKAVDEIDKKQYSILQYSAKGIIEGIKEQVDLNYSFVDFKKAKEYIDTISKINYIKLVSGLEDITIQFLSCYKWGKSLIEKIYKRLLQEKTERNPKANYSKAVQKEYNLEAKTIEFLSNYLYADDLFKKLYFACTK